MPFAFVEDGIVTRTPALLPEVFGNITGFNLADRETLAAHGWFEITEVRPTLSAGQVLSGPVYVVSTEGVIAQYEARDLSAEEIAAALATAKTKALAAAAAERWTRSSSFTFGTYTDVASDDLAQGRLTSLVVGLQALGSNGTVGWEMTAGSFHSMTLPDLVAFGAAMMQHVQACWSNYAVISNGVKNAKDLSELSTVDINSGWP